MKKIILVLLVAISMMGVAAANPYTADIFNAAGTAPVGDLALKPGDSITLSYRMTDISPVEQGLVLPYVTQVAVVSGTGAASDITITTPANVVVPLATSYTDVGVITVSLNANAPLHTIYRISIGAGPVLASTEIDSASRYVESIPEFPTIALPVAAILGLAFFMQRRKEE
ncbi:PEF-CTERM sorting domain-containing protein [Methanolobus sp. ZRKC5]|uniref:PEF-CTERM sorting domain-containing protein n=1 Tax=unclassified Methanolobus TaxID=2629569 RepID=UPI00313B7AB1